MALEPGWRDRLAAWMDELQRHIHHSLGGVEFDYFVTKKQLTPEQAAGGDFAPCPAGTKWGGKWEYGWFRGQVNLPPEADGKRIYLRPEVMGESLVWINGLVAGSVSLSHNRTLAGVRPTIPLTRCASGGERFEILIETYAGHGRWVCDVGPIPPDRQSVPEPPEFQIEHGCGQFGVFVEDVYQLSIDVRTLFLLRENIGANSLRAAEIDHALRDFTRVVDFELPREEFLETVNKARQALQPILARKNSPTSPLLHAFGHGHLDLAWLWPLAETERKNARTLGNQLALAEEYPDYRFLNSQAYLYQMLQSRYPALWRRLAEAVRDGKIIPDGAWWVEADTNISGGEALIRQGIYGKRFFREQFDLDSQVLWLPDVFGYSAALPQILRGCGIKYFATAKLFWSYHGGEPFPFNTFQWQGLDGTRVLVHMMNNYNSHTSPDMLIDLWDKRVQKDGLNSRLMPFGHGDGGGGPARDHVEFARRAEDLEGCPRVKFSTPQEFFETIEAQGVENTYVGELYFQAHRGTYTSQAKTKKGNRKSELACREAELWAVAAAMQADYTIPRQTLEEAWRDILLLQFHDILPGSSIRRVYEEAEDAYGKIQAAMEGVMAEAAATLSNKPEPEALTIFNSLSWDRVVLVELPADWPAAGDTEGDTLCVQQVDSARFAEATVPSCGWTTLRRAKVHEKPPATACAHCHDVQAEPCRLENDLLRVEFNDRGEITSLFDKHVRREFAAGPGNAFRMYKDVPSRFDAWDIDSMYEQTPVAMDAPAKIEVVCSGPLLARLRVTRKLHDSEMTQQITLRRGSRLVEFETAIDWRERHKLLKVAFETNLHTEEAVHEVQFGHIRRPNHRSRQLDRDRFEVCNHKWSALMEQRRGLGVINDCKYGVSTLDGCIQLTLLKSALAPDNTADQGLHEFTYAVYVWDGEFASSGLVRQGYELNVPILTANGSAEPTSLFRLDADNIIIEAVKPAEDKSSDVIVRLYESLRTSTRCTLKTTLPVKKAAVTDMLENEISPLELADGQVELDFRPFEIKTLRFNV